MRAKASAYSERVTSSINALASGIARSPARRLSGIGNRLTSELRTEIVDAPEGTAEAANGLIVLFSPPVTVAGRHASSRPA